MVLKIKILLVDVNLKVLNSKYLGILIMVHNKSVTLETFFPNVCLDTSIGSNLKIPNLEPSEPPKIEP